MSDHADLLRRAATLARETAAAAAHTRSDHWRVQVDPHSNGPASTVHNGINHVTGYVRPAIADHVALWQPQVTDHITAMLDCASKMVEPHERETVASTQCGWCGYDHLADISQAIIGAAPKEN